MANAIRLSKVAKSATIMLPLGALLALSPVSYAVRELLACWLFFTVAVLPLGLVIFLYAVVGYAIERAFDWASSAGSMQPKVPSTPPQLQLKVHMAGGKSQ